MSNLGPGFDTLGIAVQGMADTVRITRTADIGIDVIVSGDGGIPEDPAINTASVAASEVFRRAGYDGGAAIRIEKGIPFGSGLGGSAASAAAGAAAANILLGSILDETALVECALSGEAIASRSLHGDNVIPALIGGAVLVDSANPVRYRRLGMGADLVFAIIIPDLQIKTADARQDLPDSVGFRTAVDNASALALLVNAIVEGDVDAVGELIMRDQIVEPVRAVNIPCFQPVRQAAIGAGAGGCAISGSGPTLFAVVDSRSAAKRAVEAMWEACRSVGFDCRKLVSTVDFVGAHELVPVR